MLSLPVDGLTLTTMMHGHGVNVRYLGHLANLADKSANPVLKELCLREMITRSAKHILRSILAETEDYLIASAIAHFFNCLFGNSKAKDEGKLILFLL
jgi:protein TIF31